MNLKNKTRYRSEDLRKIILAAHESMGAPHEQKRVAVKYSHRSMIWGCASLSGGSMLLTLPGDPAKLNVTEFAQVIEHEIAHNLGLIHKDMTPEVRVCRQEVPWVAGLQIRVREEAPAPTKEDVIGQRRVKAERMADRWEKKLAIAKRQLSKWNKKVRYYEKRAARPSVEPTAGALA